MPENRKRDIAIGVAGGIAATLAVVYLGKLVLTSDWTTGVCATALAACSVGLIGWKWCMGSREDREADLSPPSYVDRSQPNWAQALKPSEWLVREGATAVAEENLAEFLAVRLATALTPIPKARAGALVERPLFEERACDLLILAFATRYCYLRDGKEELALKLLTALDRAHRNPPGTTRSEALDRVRDALSPHLATGGKIDLLLDEVWRRHGTRESLVIGLLEMARKRRGVLAPAEFLWLKGVHRPLWFALNNLGRTGGFNVEGLAAMAHYREERAPGDRSETPMVGHAVETLVRFTRDMRNGLVAE